MKILAIVGNYHPIPSSVANCVKPLLSSLIRNGHKIHILSNFPGETTVELSLSDRMSYTGIPDRYIHRTVRINAFFDSLRKTKLHWIFKRVLKLPFYLRYQILARERHMGGWSIRESVNRCLNLDNEDEFDVVISFSQPFTSHLIARKLMLKTQRKIPWIIYQFDPYSKNSEIPGRAHFFNGKPKRLEMRCLDLADVIIVTPELLEFYKGTDFSKYLHKMESVNYILFKSNETTSKTYGKMIRNYVLMYAGGFYKTIRNPLYMMEVLKGLSTKVTCQFFTNYKDEEFLNFFVNLPHRFKKKEEVLQAEITKELHKADILLSVGNTVEIQVPAKIFEYMGLGKPIIHFSKIPNDPALKYLDPYPMALIVNEYEDNLDEHVLELEVFLAKVKDKQLPYEEVIMFLPEHDFVAVSEKFLSIIKSVT